MKKKKNGKKILLKHNAIDMRLREIKQINDVIFFTSIDKWYYFDFRIGKFEKGTN